MMRTKSRAVNAWNYGNKDYIRLETLGSTTVPIRKENDKEHLSHRSFNRVGKADQPEWNRPQKRIQVSRHPWPRLDTGTTQLTLRAPTAVE
jgi:hypothetical protein